MTHIEAMKQALEFIEVTNKGSSFWLVPASQLNKTVTSLRQAIAEAEKQEPVATVHASWNDDEGFMLVKRTGERLSIGDSLYTHPKPKRTEQEQQIETLKRCLSQMQEAAKDLVEQAKSLTSPQRTEPISLQCAHCQVTIETLNDKVMHLLAQRTWVGLTDEEMHECWNSPLTPLGMKHARTIEAKLKQKNGYAEEKNT